VAWYEWVFSGIGGVVLAGVVGFVFRRKLAGRFIRVKQSQRAGDNTSQVQAGRDISADRK
jgi:hypothetical protein